MCVGAVLCDQQLTQGSERESEPQLEGADVLLKQPGRLSRLVVGEEKGNCWTLPTAGAGGEITIKHLTDFKNNRLIV